MMSVFISSINTLNYSSSHQVHNVVQDSSICIYCSLFLPGKANLNIYSGGVLEAYLFAQIYWKRQDKSAGTSLAENTCPKGVKGLHSALAASCWPFVALGKNRNILQHGETKWMETIPDPLRKNYVRAKSHLSMLRMVVKNKCRGPKAKSTENSNSRIIGVLWWHPPWARRWEYPEHREDLVSFSSPVTSFQLFAVVYSKLSKATHSSTAPPGKQIVGKLPGGQQSRHIWSVDFCDI